MLVSTLDFAKKRVKDFMIPFKDVFMLDADVQLGIS